MMNIHKGGKVVTTSVHNKSRSKSRTKTNEQRDILLSMSARNSEFDASQFAYSQV